MKFINAIAMTLLILGGLNWGLVGIWEFNLIDYLFGRIYIDRIIYVLVGISAIYVAVAWKFIKKPHHH